MIRPSARRSQGRDGAPATPEPGKAAPSSAPGTVTVEEIGEAFVLRVADAWSDEQLSPVADITPDADATLIVVAVPDDGADALWPHLAELLTRLKGRRPRFVLAMSGAGAAGVDRPALAQRIADAWEVPMVAPAGDVVLAPGGMLFVRAGDTDVSEPQWWSFAPETAPQALGPRWPAPTWQGAFAAGVPGGPCEITQVPAGVLVRPAGSPEPGLGDLPYAVSPHYERPSILVGVPGGPRMDAADLIAALSPALGAPDGPRADAALPPAVAGPDLRRHPLRLVPSGGGDLLPLGQALSRELGLDVEVFTGLPVDLAYDGGDDPAEAAAGQRVVLVDADGRPTWSPFAASVLCRPPARDGSVPHPRLESWHPPVEGMEVADEARGVLSLGDVWRLAVTRAGLWLYRADAAGEELPEQLMIRRPVTEDTVRLDIGVSGQTFEAGSSPWPVLDGLFGALPPGLRARLLLAVHGSLSAEGEESARKLADRHGVRVETDVAPEPVSAPQRTPRVSPPETAPNDSRATPTCRSTEEERAAR